MEELMQFIYENGFEQDFEQFSPYHFRIKGVDVWPTSKRYYIKGKGKSIQYKDINEIKMFIKIKNK